MGHPMLEVGVLLYFDEQYKKNFGDQSKQDIFVVLGEKAVSECARAAWSEVLSSLIIFSKYKLSHPLDIEMTQAMPNIRKPFLEASSTASTIDSVKPIWASYLQECQSHLKVVDQSKQQMILYQNKRLTSAKVSQQKTYEMKIYEAAKQASASIRQCQQIIKNIKKEGERESQYNKKICENIVFKLASDVQIAAKELRAQQKSFVEQRKTFEMTEKASFLQLAADHVLNTGMNMEQEMMEDGLQDLQERSEEIKKIVRTIYQLNEIYKQLGELVILQGSLLDRIDENIQMSKVSIQKGTMHLTKAQTYQKKTSRCACGVMIVLGVAIVILLIILMKKWSTL